LGSRAFNIIIEDEIGRIECSANPKSCAGNVKNLTAASSEQTANDSGNHKETEEHRYKLGNVCHNQLLLKVTF
jgi:hypothetical protein